MYVALKNLDQSEPALTLLYQTLNEELIAILGKHFAAVPNQTSVIMVEMEVLHNSFLLRKGACSLPLQCFTGRQDQRAA